MKLNSLKTNKPFWLITINFSIVRLVPVQASYYSPYKYYSGVQNTSVRRFL